MTATPPSPPTPPSTLGAGNPAAAGTLQVATTGDPRQDGSAAPAEGELADTVAAAARAVPGVFDLHSGTFGEVASYLPGRRVIGVRLTPQRCEVHVVVTSGTPVLEIASTVQTVVAALVGTPVDVTVEDIVDPSADGSPNPQPDGATPTKETL